jgi:hypothetical protein
MLSFVEMPSTSQQSHLLAIEGADLVQRFGGGAN